MLRTVILENPLDLPRIRPLWNELAAHHETTMFQDYVWNSIALSVFASREHMKVLYLEDDTGLVLMPCVVDSAGAISLAGERMFDYRDALIAGERSLLYRAWQSIAGWGRPLKITALRGARAHEHWSRLPLALFANAPAVASSRLSENEFRESHSRLGSRTRRLHRKGVALRRFPGTNRALVRWIYEQKARQNSEANLFRDSLRRDFMLEICGHPESGCELYTYESGGDVIAALVTFRDGRVRRFYTTYFDERWSAFSPGQLLLFEATAESLAQGLDCDYMTGEHAYKTRLATDLVPLYAVSVTPEQLRHAAERELVEKPHPSADRHIAA